MRGQLTLLLTLVLFLSSSLSVIPAEHNSLEFFEKRIRPLLVDRCYECHAEKKQKGGLRLDSAAALRQGGDSGVALVPGKPEESLIIKAISWSDPDLQMPPKNRLNDSEITVLIDWVRMGAPDPRTNAAFSLASSNAAAATNHWAYQPMKKAAFLAVKDSSWPRNDIDLFVLAKLEAQNTTPSVDADRTTLIRRAYYDLIGLPPTPEQVDAFVNDTSSDAFARVVDRLLAEPHFGERWGRHWLDVARYAESVTLRGLVFKEAWRYRDYVIDAFNRDLPFNQFIREQIAGDLLPSENIDDRRRRTIATTFLTLGNSNLEEQDKAQLRMDIVDEQLDTIGKAFLAQTIGCARCHDHKFDPIPTRDYYAMAGILRNTKTVTNANVSGWIEAPLPVEPDQERMFREHEEDVAALQAQIKAARDAAKAFAGKSSDPKSGRGFKPSVITTTDLPGIVVDSSQAKVVGEWKHSQYSKHYIGDGYLHDELKGKGEKTLTFIPELKTAGRYEVRFAYQHGPSRAPNVPVTVFHADGETTIHVNEQEAPVLDGRFVSLGQFRFEGNGFGYALVANEGTSGHVTADAVQFLPVEMLEDQRNAPGANTATKLAVNPSAKNPPAELKALEERLKQLRESGPKRPVAMAVREEQKIEDAFVHVRGSVHNLGARVPRGFLQVATLGTAPVVPDTQSGRREFAEWIASPSNPLTARVMVNRTWHWLFGAGLVRTTDNFGTTGETASHPELLDHLALQFIERGWSVKKLVREIMLSRTYQLSSQDGSSNPRAGREARRSNVDPENRLLSRANRRRLEAECIRDTMLFVSGQLRKDRGGRSFEASLSTDYGFNFSAPRRSVYVPAFRNALPEIFEAFDFADPSMVVGARNVSTVAPQALFLMNHPFVREQAQSAAQRLLDQEPKNDHARLQRAYRLTLGRLPTSGESAVAQKQIAMEPDPLKAWTDIFHALFASADFRYVN